MSVRMAHPDSGGEYWAQPGQVPHLQESGWQVAEGQDGVEVEQWPAELRRFGGQAGVRIRHPETGGETVVGADAVPFHRERGWQVVEQEPQAEEATVTEQQADGLEGLTKDQLLEEAEARGVEVRTSWAKAEILQALRDAQPPTEQPAEAAPVEQQQAGDQPAQPEEE